MIKNSYLHDFYFESSILTYLLKKFTHIPSTNWSKFHYPEVWVIIPCKNPSGIPIGQAELPCAEILSVTQGEKSYKELHRCKNIFPSVRNSPRLLVRRIHWKIRFEMVVYFSKKQIKGKYSNRHRFGRPFYMSQILYYSIE